MNARDPVSSDRRVALLLIVFAVSGCTTKQVRCSQYRPAHAEAIRQCTQMTGCKFTPDDLMYLHGYDRDCAK